MKIRAIRDEEKLFTSHNFIRQLEKWVEVFEYNDYEYEQRVKGFIKWFRRDYPKYEKVFDLLFMGYDTLYRNACDPDTETLEFRPDIKAFLDAGGEQYLRELENKLRAYCDEPCPKCGGKGTYLYANTATWRSRPGTIAGSAMTSDVCDECWGTGDTERKGRNLREDEISALKIKLGVLQELQQEMNSGAVSLEPRIKRLVRQIAAYKGEK